MEKNKLLSLDQVVTEVGGIANCSFHFDDRLVIGKRSVGGRTPYYMSFIKNSYMYKKIEYFGHYVKFAMVLYDFLSHLEKPACLTQEEYYIIIFKELDAMPLDGNLCRCIKTIHQLFTGEMRSFKSDKNHFSENILNVYSNNFFPVPNYLREYVKVVEGEDINLFSIDTDDDEILNIIYHLPHIEQAIGKVVWDNKILAEKGKKFSSRGFSLVDIQLDIQYLSNRFNIWTEVGKVSIRTTHFPSDLTFKQILEQDFFLAYGVPRRDDILRAIKAINRVDFSSIADLTEENLPVKYPLEKVLELQKLCTGLDLAIGAFRTLDVDFIYRHKAIEITGISLKVIKDYFDNCYAWYQDKDNWTTAEIIETAMCLNNFTYRGISDLVTYLDLGGTDSGILHRYGYEPELDFHKLKSKSITVDVDKDADMRHLLLSATVEKLTLNVSDSSISELEFAPTAVGVRVLKANYPNLKNISINFK